MNVGFTPAPSAAATPPVAPQFREPPIPLEDAALMEAHTQVIVEATQCSVKSAERALRRSKGVLEVAVDEILAKSGFTMIVICFCPAQEVYFGDIFRSLHMKSFFTDDQVDDIMRQPRVHPYFVRHEEYSAYARTKDWEGFFHDIIVEGEFPLIPHDAAGRATCTGGVIGAITATDGGCPLVDFLNERLFGDCRLHASFGNPFHTADRRQCKSAMHDALRAADLAYIRSIKTTNASDAADFAREIFASGNQVIVKPDSGAGSEFVTLCANMEDVEVAFAVAHGLETTQCTSTEWMVVQEYIDGEEFVVDTVSCHGQHVVTDVWTSIKTPHLCLSNRLRSSVDKEFVRNGVVRPALPSTSLLYDRLDFVPGASMLSATSDARRVVDYTVAAMNALDLVNGCAHCELRMRTDRRTGIREPVLIELNPRMQGDIPRSSNLVGYDQYLVLAYMVRMFFSAATRQPRSANKSAWSSLLAEVFPFIYKSLEDRTRCVLFLRVQEDGYLAEVGRRYITLLPTFVTFTRSSISEPAASGFIGRARKTIDLYSCPAALILEGDAASIASDVALVRLMENDRLSSSLPTWRVITTTVDTVSKWRLSTKFREIIEMRQRALAVADDVCSDEELSFTEDDQPSRLTYAQKEAFLQLQTEAEVLSFTENLQKEDIDDLAFLQMKRSEMWRARAVAGIRDAKNAVAAMDPPPLFVSNAEWTAILGCHCGGILGS